MPYWVNCGIYVLSAEALDRFPENGDHETTTFPELAAEGSLRAFRHTGLWLTVNTPKELRRADEHVTPAPGVARVSDTSFTPSRVDKPWGYELIWALSGGVRRQGAVRPRGTGAQPPVPRAQGRVVARPERPCSARARQVGGELEATEIGPGDCFRYRPGTVHRVTAIEDTTIIEVSTPQLDDVVRLEDRYGRPERDQRAS